MMWDIDTDAVSMSLNKSYYWSITTSPLNSKYFNLKVSQSGYKYLPRCLNEFK